MPGLTIMSRGERGKIQRYETPINSDGQKVGVPFLTTGGLAP